jgi:hypothetical protein
MGISEENWDATKSEISEKSIDLVCIVMML